MSDVPDRPLSRRRSSSADLRAAWAAHAEQFVAWARKPEHDSYWRFHRDQFLELLPPPGDRTLDLGCGEGRLSRDLKAMGHRVVGVDASVAMLRAADQSDPEIRLVRADAARLPFVDASFDNVIAFMSLQDVDGHRAAVAESARVLRTGGHLSIAVVHPLNSAGGFEGNEGSSAFRIDGSYLEESFYEDDVARGGLEMLFASAHRPMESYLGAIVDAGLLIDRFREPALPEDAVDLDRHRRWQRFPMFEHVRAVNQGQSSNR